MFVALANYLPTATAPNAFAQLKDAVKGFLKGKKRKNKQAQPVKQQDEQIDSASKPAIPSNSPPTLPLVAGQHSEPQTALPKPGAAAAPIAGSEFAAKEQVLKQGEDKAPVSPAAQAPVAKAEALKSDSVSAISSEHGKPLELPKTGAANDEVNTAGMDQVDIKMKRRKTKVTDICKATRTSQPTTQEPLLATGENAKPTAITPATPTAPGTAAAASAPVTETQPATKTSSEFARIIDEKMPVMAEEPPEIKTKAAAPGMSATSGPLDDFPIEDDKP